LNNPMLATCIAGKAARSPFIFLIGMLLLATAIAAVACGGDAEDRNPSLPVGAATVQAAVTPDPVSASTPATSPTQIATSTPRPTPAPEPTASPTPTRVESSTPVPEAKVEDSTSATEDAMAAELPPECLTDGSLTDPKLIASCSFEAMGRLRSVKVDVNFNLGAILLGELPPDAELPEIQMQVARVFPDEFSITMTGPDGEIMQFIFADGESYVNDVMSGGWVKIPNTPEDTAAMLLSLNMVEQQMQELNNPDIVWQEVVLSDDGSQYIVSFQPPIEQAGMQAPPLLTQLVINTQNFLHDSVSVLIVDAEGMSNKIAEFQYSSHDEPFTIDAPESYVEADASMFPPGSGSFGGNSEVPEVVALTKNGEGDVEVTFSEPVTLIGDVGLYVLEPSTGGWSLPYIDGSGTETLIFAAASADNPPLVPEESLIVGFTFDSPESDLLDEDGQVANPTFEEWTYPE
jgi:hypothetical protein